MSACPGRAAPQARLRSAARRAVLKSSRHRRQSASSGLPAAGRGGATAQRQVSFVSGGAKTTRTHVPRMRHGGQDGRVEEVECGEEAYGSHGVAPGHAADLPTELSRPLVHESRASAGTYKDADECIDAHGLRAGALRSLGRPSSTGAARSPIMPTESTRSKFELVAHRSSCYGRSESRTIRQGDDLSAAEPKRVTMRVAISIAKGDG
jgi:hypothetical protein